MCVKDGTEKCERPEKNQPCGWCVLVSCPQAKKKLEIVANRWKRDG